MTNGADLRGAFRTVDEIADECIVAVREWRDEGDDAYEPYPSGMTG